MAGLTAQSKGQRLGIYTKAEAELDARASKKPKEHKPGETVWVEVVGRRVPAVQTEKASVLRIRMQPSILRALNATLIISLALSYLRLALP